MRSRRRARIGVAAVLAVLGTAPAQAARADSPDKPPTYQTAGPTVEGAISSANAPTLRPGTYTDTIGPGEKKYYAVNLDATSSAYLSAFGLPRPGSRVRYGDGLTVLLESTDGTDCQPSSSPTFHDDDAARPVGDYLSRVIDADSRCQEAGPYLFSVQRTSDPVSDPAAWPLEIKYMLEPGLRKGSTPAPLGPGSSATPAPATGKAKAVQGGTGFNDAPAVSSGVWKDRLLPGQTRFYRVPVDWGQQLFAAAEFANAEKITNDSGYSGDGVRLELFNTARGDVTYQTSLYDGEQAAVRLLTPAADYTNRLDSSVVRRSMRFSGWYYLAVSLHSETQDFIDGGVQFTLRLRTVGEAQPGPAYQGDAVKAGFGIDADDREAASEGSVPRSGDGISRGRRLLAFAAFGLGGVLLAGLVVWLLVVRRRPADPDPADPRGRW